MLPESVSQQLVDQRIRNRVIEYLESLVAYESDPPPWNLNETINQWEDWVRSPANENNQFSAPTYTHSESAQLIRVDQAWNAFAAASPQSIEDSPAEMMRPEWIALIDSAKSALAVLMKRGRLPEEHEV